VGLTLGAAALVVGGVAVWSALDTQRAREDFERNPTRDAFDDGEAKDFRTNLLIGAGVALSVASVGVLIFGTDWSRKSGALATQRLAWELSGSTRGARVGLHGSF